MLSAVQQSRELEEWLTRTYEVNIRRMKTIRLEKCVGYINHNLPVIDHGVASILERLSNEGWGNELCHMKRQGIKWKLCRLPIVDMSKPLTDAGKYRFQHFLHAS